MKNKQIIEEIEKTIRKAPVPIHQGCYIHSKKIPTILAQSLLPLIKKLGLKCMEVDEGKILEGIKNYFKCAEGDSKLYVDCPEVLIEFDELVKSIVKRYNAQT